MRQLAAIGFGVVLLVTATGSVQAAETYPIDLARPTHVGEVVNVDATSETRVHEVRTERGQPPTTRDSVRAVHFVGPCTVLAVDGRGVATKVRCVLAQATVKVDGKLYSILPDVTLGITAVEVTNTAGQTQYARSDSIAVTADQTADLRQVLLVRPPVAPTTQDIFPPGGRRAVGDTWPMDAARAADFEPGRQKPTAKAGVRPCDVR